MEQALFVLFGAVALGGALLAVSSRNPVAAAAWLVVAFFGMAGTFVLLEAYLLAVVQVLVYAGAIMVLFLFVIMLLDLKAHELRAAGPARLRVAGIALSALFLVLVLRAIADADAKPGAVAPRAAALLRLPAPEPEPTDDPLVDPARGPAPDPVPVSLSRRAPAWIDAEEGVRARLAPAAGEVAAPERRAFSGVVATEGERRGHAVVVLLERSGEGDDAWRATGAWADADRDGTLEGSESLPGGGEGFDASSLVPGARLEVSVVQGGLDAAPYGAPDGSPFAIGRSLFEDWILPFEATSVLLLGAIFGAVVLTKRRLS
jgi:NADH-quinone oxidoreductase subunit J